MSILTSSLHQLNLLFYSVDPQVNSGHLALHEILYPIYFLLHHLCVL